MNSLHPSNRERKALLIRLAAEHKALSDELETAGSRRVRQILAEMVVNEAVMAKLTRQGVKV